MISPRRFLFPKALRTLWPVALLFIVALIPRLIGVGAFLTADEKNWVGRGVEYLRALRDFRINDTLQTTHPGIPTLVVAGASVAVAERITGTTFSFDNIRLFATAAQLPMIVINSLLVALLYLAARQVIPRAPAFLGALVLALDPFVVGYSKIVHVDAFLAGFTAIAVFLILAHVRAPSARSLVFAGCATGLAILAKLPAVVLLPFAAVALFSRREAWSARVLRENLRRFTQFLLLAGTTMLVLWPALLWVPDPLGNVKTVKRDVVTAVTLPHYTSEQYSLNPWQYPATILVRSTWPTLLGAALFFLFLISGRRTRNAALIPPRDTAGPPFGTDIHYGMPDRRTSWLLVTFVVLFLIEMTLGGKKGDRYVLPLFPFLDFFAAAGITAAFDALSRRRVHPVIARRLLPAAVLLLPLVFTLVRLGPYAIAQYNWPLPPNLSQELGWGEGLERVAAYLNALPDGNKIPAASWYPEELAAYAERQILPLTAHEQLPVGYVVLYRNMFGRPLGHIANDFLDEYFDRQTPVHSVSVNGLPYAWVYRKASYSGVVGELTPEVTLVAELPVSRGVFRGVRLYVATYTGRANSGLLSLELRERLDGPAVRTASVSVRPEMDNQWVEALFVTPFTVERDDARLFLSLRGVGTAQGNAPTLRVAPHETDQPRFWYRRGGLPSVEAFAERTDRNGRLGVEAIADAP